MKIWTEAKNGDPSYTVDGALFVSVAKGTDGQWVVLVAITPKAPVAVGEATGRALTHDQAREMVNALARAMGEVARLNQAQGDSLWPGASGPQGGDIGAH